MYKDPHIAKMDFNPPVLRATATATRLENTWRVASPGFCPRKVRKEISDEMREVQVNSLFDRTKMPLVLIVRVLEKKHSSKLFTILLYGLTSLPRLVCHELGSRTHKKLTTFSEIWTPTSYKWSHNPKKVGWNNHYYWVDESIQGSNGTLDPSNPQHIYVSGYWGQGDWTPQSSAENMTVDSYLEDHPT